MIHESGATYTDAFEMRSFALRSRDKGEARISDEKAMRGEITGERYSTDETR